MSLIGELENSIHVVEVLWVLFNTFFLIFVTVFTRFLWRLNFL
jgi:hypothetical protein